MHCYVMSAEFRPSGMYGLTHFILKNASLSVLYGTSKITALNQSKLPSG